MTTKTKQPISVTHPDIAAQWHPTRNGILASDQVIAGSNLKIWWRCSEGPDHQWQASVNHRSAGSGCPFCANREPSVTNSLAALRPDIAQRWHPNKNEGLTPDQVVSRSKKKYWWICPKSHEWEASVVGRTAGTACPVCASQNVSVTMSLAKRFPEIASQWHPSKNSYLTPNNVPARSNRRVWWKCPKGPDHEWQATISSRTGQGAGCPCCSGHKVSVTNSLASLRPDVAQEWHPTNNGDLTPGGVAAASNRRVWWKCPKGPDHEWNATINNRTSGGRGCPFCRGLKASVTNSLASLHPDVAAEWHPTKNGDLKPDGITRGSTKKIWWKCPEGPDHEWVATVNDRTPTEGHGCPFCSGLSVSVTNSLASLHPDVAAEWHPNKNGGLTPDRVVAGSTRKVWWKCQEGPDHEWVASLTNRTRGGGCPFSRGLKVSVTNSLTSLHPDVAAEWHPAKNRNLTPGKVVAGSHVKVWWRCPDGHEWLARVAERTRGRGCPVCNRGWTLEAIRVVVSSLKEHLGNFTPAELYVLFRQSGLFQTQGKSRGFIKALATGRFPLGEIDKFVNGEPSLVDQFVQDPTQTLEGIQTGDLEKAGREDRAEALVDERELGDDHALPVVQTKDALASLDQHVLSSADEEAVDFLLASALAKLWKHAFRDEAAAVAQAEAFTGSEYAERVRSKFLDEYRRAKELEIPSGYSFRIDGKPTAPNLMQRYVAARVRDRDRLGNWSGTGAGKTLSAVLGGRVIGADLTVVCCPNSSVDGWRREILNTFPNSVVATKTWDPDWAGATGDETGLGSTRAESPRYMILNYEAFQQPGSASWVRSLADRERIDFIVVDEIHFAKQRALEDISRRRQLVTALISLAGERNPDLHVLGMSATPVINNLQEGKSMVELVTGIAHDELDTRATVPNCMALHEKLVTLGVRWMPEYNLRYEQIQIPVDCGEFVQEIRALGQKGTPLALEQILTRARLSVIRKNIQPKTLIYTHYIQGIDRIIRDALQEDGWKVGFYTGEDKLGLDGFLEGDVDVLIGSSAISTGVDGLQQVCSRLIINVLPWTAGEFEQLKGRIYRQGQRGSTVTMVIPLTYADFNEQRWSWCESKMQRLYFKKSIADAAVDGVVPEGHLRTPAQAYQDLMGWLERLHTGEVKVIARPKIIVPLPSVDTSEVERRHRRYGDFSNMNRAWNRARSEVVHRKLQENPEEWAQYHTLYGEARKDWAVVPYEEMIRWCQKRSGYVIGDFGCGEARLAEAVSDRHTVYSFDHIAVNDEVVACDMAHTPVDDETLDVAIFSLSLMGANITDYVREAHRTLKLDGQLHIVEATSRFSDRDRFAADLTALGFDVVAVGDTWRFTHIRALKTERQPRHVQLSF